MCILKAADQTSSIWSGGTTTQLAIFPFDAKYEDRNFIFRISTAKVHHEHTVFSSLKGFSRSLMILEG